MKFHREGNQIILFSVFLLLALNVGGYFLLPSLFWLVLATTLILFGLILQFFRNPDRPIAHPDESRVYSPADGQVVVIEEVEEKEYFQDKRLLISIFMSPLNVHINRSPVGGKVLYKQHHSGGYLPAWNAKSSEQNERYTSVIESSRSTILIRQIAGAMARRISNYPKLGERTAQGEELGFIKFGSRVDIFLPLDAKVEVTMGQKVKGNIDVLATLP